MRSDQEALPKVDVRKPRAQRKHVVQVNLGIAQTILGTLKMGTGEGTLRDAADIWD